MLIKVCGMRSERNISEVEQLDIDLMGFIFYPKSPRYVSMVDSRSGLLPDRVATPDRRTTRVRRVGVFVDAMAQNIITRVYNYGLDYVQLHGTESPTFVDNLRRTLDPDIRPGIQIIKALSISCRDDLAQWRRYRGHADMLLFDTRCDSRGGSGHRFDWSLIESYDGDLPFVLSGGIGPDDADDIRAVRHPLMAGIDLNSRFETTPGIKDTARLRDFIHKIRQQ